jgi:hypothetical protein
LRFESELAELLIDLAMTENPEKSKIFVDEDWKSQVQAEKEKARQAAEAPATGGKPTPGSTASTDELPDGPLPPASLPFLLTTLATQAMIALGQVPNPITGKADLRLPQAKHYIDMLAMLEQKTAGNRTAEESALLDDLLHQLRMAYVLMQTAPALDAGVEKSKSQTVT